LSSHFQHRLVGVIVIVALSVIFLPDILDGKKQRQEEQFSKIPLRPQVKPTPLPPQDLNALVQEEQKTDKVEKDDSWQIETAPKRDTPTEHKPQTATEVVDSVAHAPKAWTIQLGSFNKAKNAQILVKRLQDKKFTAYTLPTRPIDGQLTKVFVGPNVSKAQLQKIHAQIEQLTALKGRIVAYNPVEK